MWVQADLDSLKAAVASGVLTVRYGDGPTGRTVTYQSLDAMRSLLASMAVEIALAAGDHGYRLAATSKGL